MNVHIVNNKVVVTDMIHILAIDKIFQSFLVSSEIFILNSYILVFKFKKKLKQSQIETPFIDIIELNET